MNVILLLNDFTTADDSSFHIDGNRVLLWKKGLPIISAAYGQEAVLYGALFQFTYNTVLE
jgi:hypothetical protein